MLKAAVFDDEYIVLRGVQAMIDWKGFGIDLIGTAGDGLAALELFRERRREMILTDIRMPGMDGLQLIERIMEEAPDTLCIVFSGFSEFEYVKRALTLGVADYIEKPITVAAVEKAIAKVLGIHRKRMEAESLQEKWEASRGELLEKATLDLIMNGSGSWQEAYGPRQEQVVGITVLTAEGDFAFPDDPAYQAVTVKHGTKRIIALFQLEAIPQELWERIEVTAEQAGAVVGVGTFRSELSQANESYKEALKALRSAWFLDMRGMVRFGDLGERMTAPEGMTEREEAIILSLRSGNRSRLLEQVESFLAWLKGEKLNAELAEHELLKVVYLGLEEVRKSGGAALASKTEGYKPHVELQELTDRGAFASWFRCQFERLSDWMLEERELSKHSAVEQACTYIEQNCSRDLTLQEVAEQVGMNASYFSVLFKEEMGVSYIKYLTKYRMELAKSLLAKGLKVQDVSERVGYHTYRHFSEVFKKYTGVTPGQYSS